MVGGLLLSATNPESGTVTYTYNGSNQIATKTDANQNQFQYTYDSYNRVTEVQHFVYQYPFGPASEDTTQRVNYSYDTNPYDGGAYSQYTQGRLAAITYQPAANSAVSSALPTFSEWYSYTQAGSLAGKQLQLSQYEGPTSTAVLNLDGSWTYNNEGKMATETYPSVSNHSGTYTTGYDTMYRPSTLTDNSSNTWASNVSYGPSNELLTLNSESRTYNSLLQLTQITVTSGSSTVFSQQYIYPTNGMNNGKAIQQNDLVSGEQVVYAYDSLNRLLSAQTTSSSTPWGQAYVYDGFGNLYQKNVTQGSAPSLSVSVNASTNQLTETGLSYDANGNALGVYPASQTYDVENRVSSAGQYNSPQVLYAYDPGNRRVWKGTVNSSGVITAQEMYFYGATGKKLGTYVATFGPLNTSYWTASDLQMHFGSRRVAHWASSTNGGTVQFFATSLDRVGSVRDAGSGNANSAFYPYGEDKGTAAPNDQTKFATYTRDSATGLDYAMNRYYSSTLGRFATPDQYANGGRMSDPQNWNLYAYAGGEPTNRTDPSGADYCDGDVLFCDFDFGYSFPGFIAPLPGPCFTGPNQTAFIPNPGCVALFTGLLAFFAPAPPKPNTDCKNNFTPAQISFVENNFGTANGLGYMSGVPSADILGWAAYESGWGTNTLATVNNNFFSWGGSGNVICPPNSARRFGCFSNPGFFFSGYWALFSTQNYFQYGGVTGVSSATILTSQFSNGASIAQAFQALANAGYDPRNSAYGATVAATTSAVIAVEICLILDGILYP